jgi:uncharacterized coiled-coil protein SlyX
LRDSRLVRAEIPYVSTLKGSLRDHGYTIEDTSKIPKLIREIEACEGNVKVFLERAEQSKDLKWEISDLLDQKERAELIVEDMKTEGFKLQNRRDELRGEIQDLETTKKQLRVETKKPDEKATAKSNDLRLTDCLTSILKSKPTDVDVLFKYAYWLKQIASGAAPDLVHRRPAYEKEVRRLIANTLAEYLKEELVSREEVTKLEEKLAEKDELISILSSEVKEGEKLLDDNKQLKEKVEGLEKDLHDCQNRFLSDPSIKPKDGRLPFWETRYH